MKDERQQKVHNFPKKRWRRKEWDFLTHVEETLLQRCNPEMTGCESRRIDQIASSTHSYSYASSNATHCNCRLDPLVADESPKAVPMRHFFFFSFFCFAFPFYFFFFFSSLASSFSVCVWVKINWVRGQLCVTLIWKMRRHSPLTMHRIGYQIKPYRLIVIYL